MKVKQFQILTCLLLTCFVTVSCRQNSSLNHNTPLSPSHTSADKKVEIIKAAPLNVNNKQSGTSIPDISGTTSDLEPTIGKQE